MKKFVLGLFLFLVFPFVVNAADYDITDFYVKANILQNGDLEVNELIVLDGDFNGYERDILYANSNLSGEDFANNRLYNASDITDVEIKAKYVDSVSMDTFNDKDFDNFNMSSYATNSSKSLYVKSSLSKGYRYRMYYHSDNNKVAFYLKYIVKDAVVLHLDVAELYWTFIPEGFEDTINNINIEVYLPNTDNSNNFRIWAHGNLSGKVDFINKSGVKANINKVFTGEAVDIRMTFDKSLVLENLIFKKSNALALDEIIKVETDRANVANNLRKELLLIRNIVIYGTVMVYMAILVLGIYIYYKYGKSPKSGYYSKYNREFIDDYNVEVIDYLMKKQITPNAMSASIMNLIYKKNLSVNEIPNDSKNKDYEFTLENKDNLDEGENILVDFLFDRVGKNRVNSDGKKCFSTLDLKKYANGTKTCTTFINSYTKWKNKVIEIGRNEKFYERSNVPIIYGLIILLLTIIVFVLGISRGVDFIPTYLLLFFAIFFFIYTILIDKKTLRGSEHYDKWKAFKNFLNDFGSFELKELPEIVLWERYLVYATIFGLADKVQKNMNVRISEMNIDTLGYDYYPSYVYINLGNTINSSINNAVNSAYSRQSANYANTHSSSSSGGGFGGGFSSGGGFGGGGGGGRGF
ncbi:MAG: DUF2207 domain-containing protein [Bacilli bacterium]|nr:DUF2207 domain-containing protein [Bacilli bacterium]